MTSQRTGFDKAQPTPRGTRWAWHLAVVLCMSAMAPVNMRGWFSADLLPANDFGGYVSVVEYVRNAILRFGYVPAWSSKWFGGSTQFTSTFKELLTLPLAVWLEPLRALQVMVLLMKVLSGVAMYAVILGLFRSPTAGIVAGYAYAFSMPASYGTSVHFHIAVSYVLFPVLFLSAVEMLRQRHAVWAVALGVSAACQFSNNYVLIAISLAAVVLLLALRPWRQAPDEDNPIVNGQLRRRWCALLALALGVFVLFAGSQLAWLATDLGNHWLHSPEGVSWGIEVFIEHSPFVYFNRGNWLGAWLAEHHPPDMPLFPDEPLRNQRHYLGIVAIIVSGLGWFLARRDHSLRQWYRVFGLLFLLQYWLSMGSRTLVWQLARTFQWPDSIDRYLHMALNAAALGCLALALVLRFCSRASTMRGTSRARSEAALGFALLFLFASHSLFGALRTVVPLVGGMRAPGHFFELAPFAFYALLGVGMVTIERVVSQARLRGLAVFSVLVLLAVDFWPGSAAYDRGTSMKPVREFRGLVRTLPTEDGTLRIGLAPWKSQTWEPPTQWRVAASLVATASDVGVTWNWLHWQAGKQWPPYVGASTLWLAEELDPRERELYRPVGDDLSRIGRVKYFLGYPNHDLGPSWTMRGVNELFSLWERPDVMPMALGYRSYVLLVGEDDLSAALSTYRASDRNLLSVSGGERLSQNPKNLIDGAASVLGNRKATLADEDSRILAERYEDKLVVIDAEEFAVRFPAFLRDREPGPVIDVSYARPAPEHIVLELDTGSEAAIVLVSEAYHPWWQATVDEQPAEVLRAQLAFMAVRVGPGDHVIDMRLERPLIVAAADRATALSWIVLALGTLIYCIARIWRRS